MATLTDSQVNDVLRYLRERSGDMADLLRRLALLESPSGDPGAVAPVLATLAAELKTAGMWVRRLPGRASGGILYARQPLRPASHPCQLLVGHCDTVWPVGSLRTMPLRAEGEQIFGPGVFDMKAGLVQLIYALQALHELELVTPAGCKVVINSDEEVGSPDSSALITRLARRAERAFLLEPAFGKSGKLKTARKAVGNFTITIKGRAAHAGISPEQGASAILELSHQVQRLFALNDAARGITVNVGTIAGGTRPNVIAADVRASVDVRVPTLADAEAVEATIRALAPVNPAITLNVDGGFHHPPMEPTERNQALWRLAYAAGRRLGLELEQTAVGGASDGNTTSQHTATLDGLGAVGDGAHADHEHVELPRLPERTALLVLLLMAPLSNSPGDKPRSSAPSGGRS